jgi:uncharacterized protein (TIGR03382 family)
MFIKTICCSAMIFVAIAALGLALRRHRRQ